MKSKIVKYFVIAVAYILVTGGLYQFRLIYLRIFETQSQTNFLDNLVFYPSSAGIGVLFVYWGLQLFELMFNHATRASFALNKGEMVKVVAIHRSRLILNIFIKQSPYGDQAPVRMIYFLKDQDVKVGFSYYFDGENLRSVIEKRAK